MDYNLQKNQNAEQTYHSIRNSIVSARHCLSAARFTVAAAGHLICVWDI